MRALRSLQATGASRSTAVREALIEAAGRREALRSEAEALAADESDRAEIAAVQELMDELSEPW